MSRPLFTVPVEEILNLEEPELCPSLLWSAARSSRDIFNCFFGASIPAPCSNCVVFNHCHVSSTGPMAVFRQLQIVIDGFPVGLSLFPCYITLQVRSFAIVMGTRSGSSCIYLSSAFEMLVRTGICQEHVSEILLGLVRKPSRIEPTAVLMDWSPHLATVAMPMQRQ